MSRDYRSIALLWLASLLVLVLAQLLGGIDARGAWLITVAKFGAGVAAILSLLALDLLRDPEGRRMLRFVAVAASSWAIGWLLLGVAAVSIADAWDWGKAGILPVLGFEGGACTGLLFSGALGLVARSRRPGVGQYVIAALLAAALATVWFSVVPVLVEGASWSGVWRALGDGTAIFVPLACLTALLLFRPLRSLWWGSAN